MNFHNHMMTTLNKMEKKQISGTMYNTSLAIVIVESWFRPLHLRMIEYVITMLGFNLTLGLCQARFNPYWSKKLTPKHSTAFNKSVYYGLPTIKNW